MEINKDFFNQKETHPVYEKKAVKTYTPPVADDSKKPAPKKKQPVEFKVSDAQAKACAVKQMEVFKILGDSGLSQHDLTDYSEYEALQDFHKLSLPATNYWRIMNLQPFINVPTTDIHFWYYFDPRCFTIKEEYQRVKKIEREQLEKRRSAIPVPAVDINVTPVENKEESPESNNAKFDPVVPEKLETTAPAVQVETIIKEKTSKSKKGTSKDTPEGQIGLF